MVRPPRELGKETFSQAHSGRGPPAMSERVSRMALSKTVETSWTRVGGQVRRANGGAATMCMHNFIIPLTLLINHTVLRALAVCSCALRRIVKLPVVEGSFSCSLSLLLHYFGLGAFSCRVLTFVRVPINWMQLSIGCLYS